MARLRVRRRNRARGRPEQVPEVPSGLVWPPPPPPQPFPLPEPDAPAADGEVTEKVNGRQR